MRILHSPYTYLENTQKVFHKSFSPKPLFKFFFNLRRYSQVKVHRQYQPHRRQICHQCQRHQWQTMGTISVCWQLYYPKVSKRNNENFSDWRFFPFATGVNDIGGAPWAVNISKNFQKSLKQSNGIIRGLGETDPFKRDYAESIYAYMENTTKELFAVIRIVSEYAGSIYILREYGESIQSIICPHWSRTWDDDGISPFKYWKKLHPKTVIC